VQRADEERAVVLHRTLKALSTQCLVTIEAALDACKRAQSAVDNIDIAADIRMFIHQRRVAIMFDELHNRQRDASTPASTSNHTGSRSRGSAGTDTAVLSSFNILTGFGGSNSINPFEDMAVVSKLRHHKDYIKSEAELAPTMYKWVTSLLHGTGSETFFGDPLLPPADTVYHATSATTAANTEESAVFEVSTLANPAARYAFLRALSARRGVQQNIGSAFFRMLRIFWWVLDLCMDDEDAKGAQTVLILSETYYRAKAQYTNAATKVQQPTTSAFVIGEDDSGADKLGGEAAVAAATDAVTGVTEHEDRQNHIPEDHREYLQVYIKRHGIWRAQFWAESFYRAVREEVTKLIDPSVASNSRLTSLFASVEADERDAELLKRGSPSALAAGDGVPDDAGAMRSASRSSTPTIPSPLPSPKPGGFGSTGGLPVHTEADQHYAYTQILFGQLMALVVNLGSFGTVDVTCNVSILVLACSAGQTCNTLMCSLLCRDAKRRCRSIAAPTCYRKWFAQADGRYAEGGGGS
jgi:hypothetical protein